MAILRLDQDTIGEGEYLIKARVEQAGQGTLSGKARVAFALDEQDREDLRWYLEDYLNHPFEPAPKIAARVEGRMEEMGTALFRAIFEANSRMRQVWGQVQGWLNETRVEIHTEVAEATAIPWELLFAPQLDEYVALRVAAFVRSYEEGRQAPRPPQAAAAGEPIRILLAICRPKGRDDVPFRSVASRLVKGLNVEASQQVQLDVLRPPTFEQLGKVLQAAQRAGKPYHVLHFDGHGAYFEVPNQPQQAKAIAEQLAELLDGVSSDFFKAARTGKHGYLLFEDATETHNMQLVDGRALGQLLVRSNVPVLVLNACRSAHADVPDEDSQTETEQPITATDSAYGSLAQEVMEQGVAGVVAMRYNLYVLTATQLVAEVYEALAQGYTLGAAVTHGRQQLALSPTREGIYGPMTLQDWSVPVVYEALPIQLFPSPPSASSDNTQFWAGNLLSSLTLPAKSGGIEGRQDSELPPAPDAGFVGRDETLLALDRAFDSQQIVLLHAYAGSGKTTTAAEFARWYKQTGGVKGNGVVLFTSFEQYQPLARVLDKLERVFGATLRQLGIDWLALSEPQRRQMALNILQQVPVLWIWDNVELVAGFPTGTESKWSAAEQRELADFLRAARGSKAKFLLTSRRNEQSWLSGLPCRIKVPSMRHPDRVELAKKLASKHGRSLTHADWKAWQPLLRFTQGNPLTLIVVVGQALRNNLHSKAQINAYVAQLRAGKAAFSDEKQQGRTKSLGASLSYGFEHAFSEAERQQLALLHFFQGFVDVQTLQWMGHPKLGHLPTVRNLTRQAAINLLDRATEIGLLTTLGGGYYRIHPALPWFFKSLFEQYYASPPSVPPNITSSKMDRGEVEDSPLPWLGEGLGVRAIRSFVEAMGELGNYYHHQYNEGNRNVITLLSAEEANLLHAHQLAREHGFYWRITSTMQGLRYLYHQTGQRAEWQRLVSEIVPDFVDPSNDGPLPGREQQWGLVTQYRVRLAREARQWADAEHLQQTSVKWSRQRAALALQIAQPNRSQRHTIRTLAVSVEQLGHIQREQGHPKCAVAYEEAIPLLQRIGDQAAEAILAFNLGHAYCEIPALRDLAQAEQWYQRSLELTAEEDIYQRGKGLGQLGFVAYERFEEARDAQQPAAVQLEHLNAALTYYRQSLSLLPANAVNDLAVAHNQLGLIYNDAGDLERALPHYRDAIRYDETAGNFYGAARTRRNVALALAQKERWEDAQAYAQAALRGFERYGAGAADMIQETQRTLAAIEQAMG